MNGPWGHMALYRTVHFSLLSTLSSYIHIITIAMYTSQWHLQPPPAGSGTTFSYCFFNFKARVLISL